MKNMCFVLLGFLLLVPLSACGTGFSPTPLPTATSTLTTSVTVTATSQPSATTRPATITPLPTRITPTVYPPETPPLDWQTIHVDAYELSLSIPPGWQVETTYREIIPGKTISLSSRQISGEGTNAACVLEANRPDRYGNHPLVNLWNSNNSFYGCEIRPSDDSSASSNVTILVWYPYWVKAEQILLITAPSDDLRAIENSLQYLGEKEQWVGNSDLVPVECYLNKMPPEQTFMDGLAFSEYRLTSSDCYQHMNVDSFAPLMPKEAAQRRQELHNSSGFNRDQLNQQLEPFGYQIRNNMLYLGENPQTKLLGWVSKPLINASQTFFILPYTDNESSSYSYFSNQTLPSVKNNWFYSSFGFVPHYAFLGDDLLWIQFEMHHLTPVGAPTKLQLFRNNELIFTYSVLPSSPASGPVRGLYTWDGHWFLEVNDILIRDGIVLNQEQNYSEMFAFRVINEQPFYFYRQGDQIHIYYAGKTLSETYQKVIHEPSCCSGGQVNMTLGDNGLGFFAQRDGYWYYVIIEG